ncbi:MAG: hypothetical protein C0624_06740 [Desulfuromonas sp.]|nr:MAG: hypothetical protein C0624_06740 [Desulfuromonas sp.]
MKFSSQFFDALSDPAYIVDSDFRFQRINRSALSLISGSGTPGTASTCFEHFGQNEACLNCPVPQVFHSEESIEKEIYSKPLARWWQMKAFPIKEAGHIVGVGVISTDISALKTLEQSMPGDHHKIKNFIDRMPIGCILFDPQFKITLWNPAAEKIFGYSEAEALGKHPYDIIVSEEVIQQTDKVKAKLQKGHDNSHRTGENITKDGRTIICNWMNTPIHDADGEVVAILSMAQDITHETTLQKEAIRNAQLATLGQLAASVAHEINSPLNGIINYAELLEERGAQQNKTEELARRINQDATRIEKIVKNLLNYSRDSQEDKEECDARDIITAATEILEVQFKHSAFEISSQWLTPRPLITCNFQKIEQVIINILRNAYEALSEQSSQEKKITFSESIIPCGDDAYYELVIANNGPHIPEEQLKKIMQPFYSTKHHLGGTGLGLCISAEIMKAHGGKLEISSIPGGLTAFSLFFPVDPKQIQQK